MFYQIKCGNYKVEIYGSDMIEIIKESDTNYMCGDESLYFTIDELRELLEECEKFLSDKDDE